MLLMIGVCLVLAVVCFIAGERVTKAFYTVELEHAESQKARCARLMEERDKLLADQLQFLTDQRSTREEYERSVTLIGDYLKEHYPSAFSEVADLLEKTFPDEVA